MTRRPMKTSELVKGEHYLWRQGSPHHGHGGAYYEGRIGSPHAARCVGCGDTVLGIFNGWLETLEDDES